MYIFNRHNHTNYLLLKIILIYVQNKFCIIIEANNVPEKIPTIKKKLIVLPDFPTSSLGTCEGAREKVVDVTNPLVKANKIILRHTSIPCAVD